MQLIINNRGVIGANIDTLTANGNFYTVSNESWLFSGFLLYYNESSYTGKLRASITLTKSGASPLYKILAINTPNDIVIGKWYRAVVVWDGAYFSLDGQVIEKKASNGYVMTASNNPLTLGAVNYDSNFIHTPLNGDIDEVRVWTDITALGRDASTMDGQADVAYNIRQQSLHSGRH